MSDKENLSRPATEKEKKIVHDHLLNLMITMAPKENSDNSIVGDSRDESTVHQVIVIAVSTAIGIALDVIPGMEIIQVAGLIIDLVNPYDYLNSLSRSGLDGMSQNLINTVIKGLKGEDGKSNVDKITDDTYNQITSSGTTVSKEAVRKMVETQTNYWFALQNPQVQAECYGNFNKKGDPENNQLSGAPKEGCNALYTQYYNNYTQENKEDYSKGIYAAAGIIYENIISNNLKKYKTTVIQLFGLGAVIVGFLLLIFFGIMYFTRKKG